MNNDNQPVVNNNRANDLTYGLFFHVGPDWTDAQLLANNQVFIFTLSLYKSNQYANFRCDENLGVISSTQYY